MGIGIIKFIPSILNPARVSFLLIIASLLSACASTDSASPHQIAAYEAASAGKINEARKLLGDDSRNSLTTFMLSCLELSEGNLVQARQYADEFVASEPNVSDGMVLRELIANRKAYPKEPWLLSFVAAWKAAGSPTMTDIINMFYPQCDKAMKKCEPREIPETIRSTPDEMLAAFEYGLDCDSEKFVELCLTHTLANTPVPIRLVALNWLDIKLSVHGTELSDELRERALMRQKEVIHELSIDLPQDMNFAIMDVLNKVSDNDRFSAENVEDIEKAVSRHKLAILPIDVYKEYLKRFISLGTQLPYLNASVTAFDVDDISYLIKLKKKALATAETASPEIKDRLAALLWRVGKAQVRHGTLVELLSSVSILHAVSEIRGDKVEMHGKAVAEFGSRLVQTFSTNATSAAYLWPILPLMAESTEYRIRNEIAFYQLFADIDYPPEVLVLLRD